MLPAVTIARFSSASFTQVENFRAVAGDAIVEEVIALAKDLKGLRVCHLNSTGFGGGVAELLVRHVPLSRALGIQADWRLMLGKPEFFTVTKCMHNALQGAGVPPTDAQKKLYLSINRESARLLNTDYDVFVVHDPQPAAFKEAAGDRGAKWIWRCHIDTSAPNPAVAEFLLPFLQGYHAAVFTMAEFILPGLTLPHLAVIPPAIDPFSTKTMELPESICREVIANAGFDLGRPLVLQVSRFDPWKDPMGVVVAYRLAREEVPGLQLALIGSMAGDDPEGWKLLAQVQEETASDPDIQIFTNLAGVGNLEVNAFQRAANLVIQKSLREGFGLVVSEAFWKGKPMVCGRAGGIPMQFPEGFDKYLIDSVGDCAERMVDLLRDPDAGRAFGAAARERVRQAFLLPRMLRDELRLFKKVMGGTLTPGSGY
jgi:trehalose synthase